MQSKFNTVFNTYCYSNIVENVNPNNTSTSTPTSSTITTNTSAISSTTDTVSSQSLWQKAKDGAATLVSITPEILSNMKAKADFWTGEAGNGVDLLKQAFENYNDKKRLNALYGTIDYLKAKNPILNVEQNIVTKSINQALLTNENE